jgi:hypothetical protein
VGVVPTMRDPQPNRPKRDADGVAAETRFDEARQAEAARSSWSGGLRIKARGGSSTAGAGRPWRALNEAADHAG